MGREQDATGRGGMGWINRLYGWDGSIDYILISLNFFCAIPQDS
jgi:hypothetical protein